MNSAKRPLTHPLVVLACFLVTLTGLDASAIHFTVAAITVVLFAAVILNRPMAIELRRDAAKIRVHRKRRSRGSRAPDDRL